MEVNATTRAGIEQRIQMKIAYLLSIPRIVGRRSTPDEKERRRPSRCPAIIARCKGARVHLFTVLRLTEGLQYDYLRILFPNTVHTFQLRSSLRRPYPLSPFLFIAPLAVAGPHVAGSPADLHPPESATEVNYGRGFRLFARAFLIRARRGKLESD